MAIVGKKQFLVMSAYKVFQRKWVATWRPEGQCRYSRQGPEQPVYWIHSPWGLESRLMITGLGAKTQNVSHSLRWLRRNDRDVGECQGDTVKEP